MVINGLTYRAYLLIYNKGTLVINDSDGNGSILYTGQSGYAIYNEDSLTINGGTIGGDNYLDLASEKTAIIRDEATVESHNFVAKIGENYYKTLATALTAAQDGATITLLWAEGDAPIAMNGAVYGKTVTITGTATVDWSKGFLFVGYEFQIDRFIAV